MNPARKILRELTAPVRHFTAELSAFSVRQTYGVPHTFNPNLTIGAAILAVAVAMTRIFLGSVVFAIWGVGAWMTYGAIHNGILCFLAELPIVAMFALSMAASWLASTPPRIGFTANSLPLLNPKTQQHVQYERKQPRS